VIRAPQKIRLLGSCWVTAKKGQPIFIAHFTWGTLTMALYRYTSGSRPFQRYRHTTKNLYMFASHFHANNIVNVRSYIIFLSDGCLCFESK